MGEITTEILRSIGMEDFTEEEEAVWKDWASLIYNDDPNNLKKIILEEDYKIKFKQRAIIVMLAPDFNKLPFYWRDNYSRQRLNFCSNFPIRKDIDERLIPFICDLILECLKILDYKPEKYAILSKTENYFDITLISYQSYLADILKLICLRFSEDEKRKETIISYFLSGDFLDENMEFLSEYCNPFFDLMSKPEIDESLKIRVDNKMRDILLTMENKIGPRTNFYDNIFISYANFVNEIISSEYYYKYSRELLASQINFVMDNAYKIITECEFIKNYNIPRILDIFSGDEYKSFRLALCRFILSKNEKDLKIYCKDILNAAKEMREEFFSNLDRNLKNKLERIIAAGEKYILTAEKSQKIAEKNQKIYDKSRKEIIAKMKNK